MIFRRSKHFVIVLGGPDPLSPPLDPRTKREMAALPHCILASVRVYMFAWHLTYLPYSTIG